MKTRIYLAICLAFLLSFFPTKSFLSEFMTEPNLVELTGEIFERQFLNPNTNKQEEVFVLRLNTPIDVAGDEFNGPAKGIKEIQLVLSQELFSYKVVREKYLNKKVVVKGSLFHAHTVHHYTEVLIQVRSIKTS